MGEGLCIHVRGWEIRMGKSLLLWGSALSFACVMNGTVSLGLLPCLQLCRDGSFGAPSCLSFPPLNSAEQTEGAAFVNVSSVSEQCGEKPCERDHRWS